MDKFPSLETSAVEKKIHEFEIYQFPATDIRVRDTAYRRKVCIVALLYIHNIHELESKN